MKIPLGDRQVEGERVGFSMEKDDWQVLRAEDGTAIRLKPVVTDLFKTSEVAPDGTPVFVLRTQLVVVTDPPNGGAKGGN